MAHAWAHDREYDGHGNNHIHERGNGYSDEVTDTTDMYDGDATDTDDATDMGDATYTMIQRSRTIKRRQCWPWTDLVMGHHLKNAAQCLRSDLLVGSLLYPRPVLYTRWIIVTDEKRQPHPYKACSTRKITTQLKSLRGSKIHKFPVRSHISRQAPRSTEWLIIGFHRKKLIPWS